MPDRAQCGNLISLGRLLLFDAKSPMQKKDAFLSTSNIISPAAPAAASPTVHKHTLKRSKIVRECTEPMHGSHRDKAHRSHRGKANDSRAVTAEHTNPITAELMTAEPIAAKPMVAEPVVAEPNDPIAGGTHRG